MANYIQGYGSPSTSIIVKKALQKSVKSVEWYRHKISEGALSYWYLIFCSMQFQSIPKAPAMYPVWKAVQGMLEWCGDST